MTKPTLVLDFDGVIHSYTSGWKGATEIPDPPVNGAIEFIIAASEHFVIAIYSSRTKEPEGIAAMRDWLLNYWLDAGYGTGSHWQTFLDIQWPTSKPAAFLTIDDRAIQFNGQWPDPKLLLDFKPWNKGGNQYTEIDQVYAERNHLVAALARLFPSGITKTNIPSWDPEWHNIVYIDLPTGQISYHYHDREAYLFEGLPEYEGAWDGHNKTDVHHRLRNLMRMWPILKGNKIMEPEPRIRPPWRSPTKEEQEDPRFLAIWNVIKSWDVNVPDQYIGYCGATGSHVCAIWDALVLPPYTPDEAMLDAARDWSAKKYGKPIGNEAAIECWQAMFSIHSRQK